MAQTLQCASSQSFSFFFRVLQPGFNNRLKLPTKFVNDVLAKEESKLKSATLVNPVGDGWRVEVYKNGDQEVHIGGLGWADLAHAHNLGLGYFLVFRYQGNMVFYFRAFDLSTCEIAYPSIVEWVAKKLKQREPILIHVEDEEKRSEEEEECSNLSNVSTKAYTGDKEKQLTRSNAMRFFVKLSAHHLRKGDVNIPARLIQESNGLWEQEELSLKDPKGRLWTIRLRKRSRPWCAMAKGWVMFARTHKLEVGDRCIFELVSQGKGKENVMQVKILKKHQA